MSRRFKIGIAVFPGSNCERDAWDAVTKHLDAEAVMLWHQHTDLQGVDAVILPGGFSYGDYLRSGALARFSPIVAEVVRLADRGGLVLGICNGFQILTECGLLPGALVKNSTLTFHCDHVAVVVENNQTTFTSAYQAKQVIQLPIAHAEGNFVAEPDVIQQLEDNGQVVFRYVEDVNGSTNRIAGVCNAKGNVLGLMPHPERNLWPSESFTGGGCGLFDSLKTSLNQLLVV